MTIGRVNAAKFISRYLGEPHDADLGGEEAHELFNSAHADICCPPSGHRIGWRDVYGSADMLPLTWKADLFLEPDGELRPLAGHLVGERAERARQLAVWIRSEARSGSVTTNQWALNCSGSDGGARVPRRGPSGVSKLVVDQGKPPIGGFSAVTAAVMQTATLRAEAFDPAAQGLHAHEQGHSLLRSSTACVGVQGITALARFS
ncbi:hypothetical protein [Streptomyces sp. NPDC016845]|uniref:hypothetical protein n=1 Tax=Streptomyces sp. NPDC016845 TaxID=3364972 RepID=UPI0037911BDE